MTAFIDDPIMRPFWEGCTRNELRVQSCDSCGHLQFYARPRCLKCYSQEQRWIIATGRAIVYSASEITAPLLLAAVPPYRIALVDLAEGPRLLTELVDDAEIGADVTVQWRERDGEPPLPVFGRTPPPAGVTREDR